MPDSLNYVREVAKAIGLKLPEEREANVAEALESALKQVEVIRAETATAPVPTAFDAAWSTKK